MSKNGNKRHEKGYQSLSHEANEADYRPNMYVSVSRESLSWVLAGIS